MKNFETHEFDDPRNWIRKKRQKGTSWDILLLACKNSDEELEDFLNDQVDNNDWPEMEVADWVTLVKLEEEAENETISIATENGEATLLDDTEDNAVTIPTDRNSAWQIYKKTLQDKDFKPKSIEIMERATLKILKRLNDDTTNSKPIKGLVIGNVQSGKTANMAALMAMAADWGWNMFIILSGTIDNLRKQTQSRLFGDLNQQRCRLVWRSLTHLKKKMAPGDRAQDLDFSSNSMQRYFTVCLKNSTRLKDLIQWLQYSPTSQGQMKILVIDDEADQAGINTASISEAERTRINKFLCSLVNGKNEKNQDIDSHYQAMNYIGYTATPYANVLNEAGEESLYPRNFITTLSVSKEYFGPQQIFGSENTDYEGLDIVRTIKDDEIEAIKLIHNGDTNILFESLINSICWFICGVACMRLWGYKKPISMLVHTSQRTVHHDFISRAIQNWLLSNTEAYIIECCKRVWTTECETFSFEKFKEQYKDYDCADEEINKYPNFDDLLNNIRQILRGDRVSNIKLGEDKTLTYHDGIHLCVDNCRNNGTDGEWYVRLAYPDKEHMPSPAPAFIVVGGATLSRGLTLEGLISTFFLRTVNQADTLMQMGRWFGYRKGYELIPRIWLTKKTIDQFKFLSDLDQELREEIHVMEVMGKSPSKYGPRIKNTPRLNFIRITANNRMQSAQPTDLDYSGTFKQTQLFYSNVEVLTGNLDKTKQLLLDLGTPDGNPNGRSPEEKKTFRNAIVWRNISFSKIKGYLSSYKFHERQSVLNNMEALLSWIEQITDKGELKDWNVVIAGTENKQTEKQFDLGNGLKISKVNRARKKENRPDPSVINIGALRNTKDLLADIDPNNVSEELKQKIMDPNMKDTIKVRQEAGYGDIPFLLLYIVDKDSKASQGSQTREDLHAPLDMAGVCINIPSNGTDRSNTVATISIHFPEEDLFNDNGDIEDANED